MRPSFSRNLTLRLLLAGVLALCLVAGAAEGAEKEKKRKKNYILSETTARKMLKVGELAQEDDYKAALEILDTLANRSRMKAHDKAVVYQNQGLMLAALERYPEATVSLELALEQDALPYSTMEQLRYNLAQLQMANENFARAIELLVEWFENAENPNVMAHFLLTAAYAQTDQFDKALPHARAMVEKSEHPAEQHLGLLLACEYQNGNLIETLEVLKRLTSMYPRKNYFMQLAYGYANMGEDEKALAMMELANAQGWIEKNDEYVNLAQRYLMHELPYQASEVMQTGFDKGIIEASSKNYELLASALLHAREYDKALPPLSKAAEMSEDGELYVRLAQVYLEVEDWTKARKALESAVERGGLRDPGTAQLLIGISNFNEERFESARSAFLIAAKSKKTKESATKWLKHVEREIGGGEPG